MADIDLLFKVVSQESHAHDFLENGTILLRNLPWFRYVEAQGTTSSHLKEVQEGGAYPSAYDWSGGQPIIEGIPFKKSGLIRVPMPEENNKYLFCLSRYTPYEGSQLHINEKFLCFGDYVIVILDGDEFIRRFEEAVGNISETRSYMGHPVEYLDPQALQGRRDLWRKEIQFEWQNEYRFLWETIHIRDGEIILHLGSLADIARVYPTRSLVNYR